MHCEFNDNEWYSEQLVVGVDLIAQILKCRRVNMYRQVIRLGILRYEQEKFLCLSPKSDRIKG